ncbi:MAG: DUF1553 domain-containing protein [Planctomycetota bacterium]|nr:MAG: DUF1553 domain-containing protein [Planctomycetota bacterium]
MNHRLDNANLHILPSAWRWALAVVLTGVLASAGDARGETNRGGPADNAHRIASLVIYPGEIHLTHAGAQQPLVVQATREDGVTLDVTDRVELHVENGQLAHLANATLFADQDGDTRLVARLAGRVAHAAVRIRDTHQPRDLSFRNDVIPVLSKVGCSSGACHGASRGKDGFNLSLLGYDPAGDHFRLTREISGRRINLALPRESLLLEKATGNVPHTGGKLLASGDPHYRMLEAWLREGAPNDAETAAQVDSIKLYPPAAVLEGAGSRQRLRVLATYSDGTRRDVTTLTRFETSNEFAAELDAELDEGAVVRAKGHGEAFLTAHFDVHSVGMRVLTLPADLEFAWPEVPEHNFIDTHVFNKLKKLRIAPSELASDAVFLRRVMLDLCGRLPTADEHRSFVADESSTKRAALIDELLESPEFHDLWVMKWSELLQMRTGPKITKKALMRYYNWLRDQIEGDVPVDRMVYELVAASGGTFAHAPTNFYQSEPEIAKTAENTAQLFLGIRLQCAQCHNHVFDRWTMDDYYGYAAFFARVGRKPGEDPRETVIFNRPAGEMKHPVDKRKMPPRFLGGELADIGEEDRRVVLARWMTAAENPYFARHMANLVWAHFFGQGIVEPVDDVRVSNPPVNPELLDALAARFVEHDFRLKELVRDICNSRTYQLSALPNETNATDEHNFARAKLRRLPAAVMLDVINQVTETTSKFKDVEEGGRAVEIPDGATTNYFLVTFGRSARETVCTCETRREPNLSQALHLINGATVHHKIRQGKVVRRMLEDNKSPAEVAEALYVRCLGRAPTERERTAIDDELAAADKPREVLHDVFWALLNSQEFLFNH